MSSTSSLSVLCAALAGLSGASCAAGGPPASSPAQPVARDWSAPVDFTALRQEFGARADFSDLCERERPGARIVAAMEASDWSRAVDLSEAWLAGCPVDAQVHRFAAVALLELDRQAESQGHQLWYRGLIRSILATGDGKTPATAFVTISVAEEYAVLSAFDLRKLSQALQRDPLVDAITAEDRSGGRATIYFNPAAYFERVSRERDAPARKP
jgi:hypothetical protein